MRMQDIKPEFVERTIDLLDRLYPVEEHEATLLLNLTFGLIVWPFEHSKRAQGNTKWPQVVPTDERLIADCPEWGLSDVELVTLTFRDENNKVVTKKWGEVSIREAIYLMRHSLAHTRIIRYLSKGKTVTKVELENKYGITKFQAVVQIEDLKTFARQVGEQFVSGTKDVSSR